MASPIKVLILTADPMRSVGHAPLRLGAEVRLIEESLRRSCKQDRFAVATKFAVRTIDLRRALLDYRPQIVHFSGHGTGSKGLVLENDAGTLQLVSTEALAGLFGIFETGKIECVLLNACYSETQAISIHQFVDCVIGMNQPIGDKAAIQFSEGFYDALGAGSTYDEAFKIGCSAIALEGSSEYSTPVLKYRKRAGGGLPSSQVVTEMIQGTESVPTAALSVKSAPSPSIGNVTKSGRGNNFSPVQAGDDATVSQNNSHQSMTIQGSHVYGQVGQAGGELFQSQSQSQGGETKKLLPDDVVRILTQIESLLKSSNLSENQKAKAVACIGMARDEAISEAPDKDFAAKSLQKVVKILQTKNEAVDVGQSLSGKVSPLLRQLLSWLGVTSHFFELSEVPHE
ncbi:MAG: CHAT domain-containing protein [Cyanobacteria bacterium J06560_6]